MGRFDPPIRTDGPGPTPQDAADLARGRSNQTLCLTRVAAADGPWIGPDRNASPAGAILSKHRRDATVAPRTTQRVGGGRCRDRSHPTSPGPQHPADPFFRTTVAGAAHGCDAPACSFHGASAEHSRRRGVERCGSGFNHRRNRRSRNPERATALRAIIIAVRLCSERARLLVFGRRPNMR